MKKLALFVEGKCERNLCEFFARKVCSTALVTRDISEFLDHPSGLSNRPIILIYDCGGHQNVLAKIKDYRDSHWAVSMVAVRDLEKVTCYTALKSEFVHVIPSLSTQTVKFGLFAKPCIEALYQADVPLLIKVISKLFEATHGNTDVPSTLGNSINRLNWQSPQVGIRSVCATHNLAYNKPRISEKFFSQFDFQGTDFAYFMRMKQIFVEALS